MIHYNLHAQRGNPFANESIVHASVNVIDSKKTISYTKFAFE